MSRLSYSTNRSDERGPWYLLTGFLIGVVLGLVYAWFISPVRYLEAPPAAMQASAKDQYRTMIALAYAADGDLQRARARLALLGEENLAPVLAAQAQRALAVGSPASEAQALGKLAAALSQVTSAAPFVGDTSTATVTQQAAAGMAETAVLITVTSPTTPAAPLDQSTSVVTRESLTPQASLSGGPSFTPAPTKTPTATPGAPFVLQSRQFICDPTLKQPLLQIQVFDAAGQAIAGVQALISWESGRDTFITGLKPERGLGYADYILTPGVVYTLQLSVGGQLISDIATAGCQTSRGEHYWGSWMLTFVQP